MKPITFDSAMSVGCGVSEKKTAGKKKKKKLKRKLGTRYKLPRGVSFFPSGLKIACRLLPRLERKYLMAVDRTPSP